MKTVVFLVFCLVLGVMLKHEGIAALVWMPIGFVFGFYVTTQTIVLLILGLPRAIRRVARRQMRAAVIGRILLTPLIWLFALFVIGLICGFFWPLAVDYLYNNAAFNWAGDLSFYGIVISMLFPGYRAAFRADFDIRYRQFNIEGVPAPVDQGGASTTGAPAGQPSLPPYTLHVTVGGKQYPIFTNPKGQRAYLKDGKYIPMSAPPATAQPAAAQPGNPASVQPAVAPAAQPAAGKLYMINSVTKALIDLPARFAFAVVAFTLSGWIGWLGMLLVILKLIGVMHWPWWLAALPLEYGGLYCLYMTIDGALYRAGLKDVGAYARLTQNELLTKYEQSQSQIQKIISEGPERIGSTIEALIRPSSAAAAPQPGNPAPAQLGGSPEGQPSSTAPQFPQLHESLLGNSRVPTPDEVGKLPAETLFRGPDRKIWRAKGGVKKPAEGENATAPAATSPPSAGAPAKLYSINPSNNEPVISPSVKSPPDLLKAVQQMHDDGLLTQEQAMAKLQQFGFKPKQPPPAQ